MKPEKVLKDYYKSFIEASNKDLSYYTNLLHLEKIKYNVFRDYVKSKIEYYKDKGIVLTDYKIEWIIGRYNEKEELYNKVMSIYNSLSEDDAKTDIIQLIKYCASIKKIYNYNNIIEQIKIRKDITFVQYKEIIKAYYYKVQEAVLEGFAYSFSYGIGDVSIVRFKRSENAKPIVDFNATNQKKKEIIAKGLEPYDKKKAEIYATRGMKYEGIPYIVYKTDNVIYKIDFTGGNITRKYKYKFEHTEYVKKSLRGLGYKKVAESITNRNEIFALECDIRFKLNVLLEFDKTQYIKYIRNPDANQSSNYAKGVKLKVRRSIY